MARLPRRQVADPVNQQAVEPLRRKIDELDGGIKFLQVEAPLGQTYEEGTIILADATIVKLKHRLGRRMMGWVLADLRGASASGIVQRVTTDGTSSPDETKELWLQADNYGGQIGVKILVF